MKNKKEEQEARKDIKKHEQFIILLSYYLLFMQLNIYLSVNHIVSYSI